MACRLRHADVARPATDRATGRYIVLDVTLELRRSSASGPALSAPVQYDELAKSLGVALGDQVPLEQAHAAVLELRRRKGMLLDPDDPDTRSAGSFFTNPALTPEQFAEVQRRAAERRSPQTRVPHIRADNGDGG